MQDGGADIFTLLEQTMFAAAARHQQRQQARRRNPLPGKGHPLSRTQVVQRQPIWKLLRRVLRKIAARIESLSLISFNIEQYRKGKLTRNRTCAAYSNALIGILKTLYLKRLESSLAAFEVSIRRQQQFQKRFYDMLVNHERLLDSATNRRLLALEAMEDDSVTDDIDAIIETLPEADIRDYDLRAIRRELSLDMQTLDAILDMVALVQRQAEEQKRDAKLVEVKRLLAEDLRGQKVLIFSYYRDTAQYLYEALSADPDWQESWSMPPVIEVIHGDTDPHRREQIVKRFAPKANSTEDSPAPISNTHRKSTS